MPVQLSLKVSNKLTIHYKLPTSNKNHL